MGADLPPGRYIGHALQRGAACRCDQAPGQPGTGPLHWPPSGGLQSACPGQGAVLAGVLLASPSTLGPAGWWPMGPGRTIRPGPGGPRCATRP